MVGSLDNQQPNDIVENASPLTDLQEQLQLPDEAISTLEKIFPEEVDNEDSALFFILSVYHENAQVYYRDDTAKATALVSLAIKDYAKRPVDSYNLQDFQGFLVEKFFDIEESGDVLQVEIDAIAEQTKLEMEILLPDMKKLDDAILAFQKHLHLDSGKFQLLLEDIRDKYLTDNIANDLWVFTILTAYYDAEWVDKLFSLVDIYGAPETLLDYLLDEYFTQDQDTQEEIIAISPDTKPTIVSPVANKIAWLQLQSFDRKIAEARNLLDKKYTFTQEDGQSIIDHNFSKKPAENLFLHYVNVLWFSRDVNTGQSKSLSEKVSTVDVVRNSDVVPGAIMQSLKIKDIGQARILKKFRYNAFVSLVAKNAWTYAREMVDGALIKLFKSRLFGDTKLTKFITHPDDVAALVSYYLNYNTMPKDPAQVIATMTQAKDFFSEEKKKYVAEVEEWARKKSNYDVAKFQEEKETFIEAEVDKLVGAILHPKGWFDIQYIVTWRNKKGAELTMCGETSCLTLRNVVKAGWVDKPIHYLWPAEFDQIDDVIDSGEVPVLRWDVIQILNAFKKHNLWETFSWSTTQELFDNIKSKLPYLATKYNSSVFEMYFDTSGMVSIVDKNTWENKREYRKKAHRTHFALWPDGNWQVFDPYFNPAWWLAKRKWFSPEVFFDKMSKRVVKSRKETDYKVIINTSVQYGYLADDIVQTLAHANYLLQNPLARELFDKKMKGAILPADLAQYEEFVPDELQQIIDENIVLEFQDLEHAFPSAQYEILEEIYLIVEGIDNVFVKSMIIGYLLQWDVSWLRKELAPDQEPSNTLDKKLIQLLEESSVPHNDNEENFSTVWLDTWSHTAP